MDFVPDGLPRWAALSCADGDHGARQEPFAALFYWGGVGVEFISGVSGGG